MLAGGADRRFERLYRRHVGDVYRYASTVLTNAADAEDVTQTVFLNAYRAYSGGERPDQPLNWLITITHNVCRQRFRDGARRPREVALDEDLTTAPLQDGEERYRREDIVRALDQLSLNQRAALVLRELEGRSYGEIASILKLSTSAIETLIFRARRAFREQLEGSLTCSEAEGAISLQLDGRLERSQRGPLRAHLRSCPGCASLARRFRAQRSALRGLAVLPLPQSLAGGFGAGGGAAVGTALGVKAVAFGTAAIVAVGAGTTEIVRQVHAKSSPVRAPRAARSATPAVTPPPAQLASAAEPATAPTASVQSSHIIAAPARTRHNTTTTTTTPPTAQAPTPAATPIAVVTESSTAAPGHERGVRDKTAARRQPQPSGGGVPRHESNTREVHHGRPADPGSQTESNGRPDTPGNSDHSKSDDHPGQDKNGGGPPAEKNEPPRQQPNVSLPASEDQPGLGAPGVPEQPQNPSSKPKDIGPPGKKR